MAILLAAVISLKEEGDGIREWQGQMVEIIADSKIGSVIVQIGEMKWRFGGETKSHQELNQIGPKRTV